MIAILDRIMKTLLPPFQRPTMLKMLRDLSYCPGFSADSLRTACDHLLSLPPNYNQPLGSPDIETAEHNHGEYLDITEILPE